MQLNHAPERELADSSPSTDLASQLNALIESFEPEERHAFRQLEQSIKKDAERQFHAEYETGKKILAAKPFFPWGKGRLFIFWQSQLTGLREGMSTRIRNLAETFSKYESHPEFDRLAAVSATARDLIAGATVPQTAKDAFFEKVANGETPTKEEVTILIKQHRKPEDLSQTAKFTRTSEKVFLWGELQVSEDSDDFKYYLVDRTTGDPYYFKTLTQAESDYKRWRLESAKELTQQLEPVLTPHWSVKFCSIRSKPYQVIVSSLIEGFTKDLYITTPLLTEVWWFEKGKKWTEQYLERKAAKSNSENSSAEVLPSVEQLNPDKEGWKPSCKNCGWHIENHEANEPGWVYCGFFQEPKSEDRIEELPMHCRHWRHPDNDTPAKLEPLVTRTITRPTPIRVKSEPQSHSVSVQSFSPPASPVHSRYDPDSFEGLNRSSIDLQSLKHWIWEDCNDEDLDALEALIQERRAQREARDLSRQATVSH